MYRKPTYTGVYPNWKSWAPTKYKTSVIRALHCRARRICSTEVLFFRELKSIRNNLLRNAYPFKLIKQFESHTCKLRSTLHMRPIPPKEDISTPDFTQLFIKLPLCGGLSTSIAKSINKLCSNSCPNLKLQISYDCRKINSFFKVKDKIPDLYNSGCIYHIKCGEESCNENYVGESKLRLCDRVKKHIRADYFKEFSSIHTHCKNLSHKLPDPIDIKVLAIENSWHRRKIKESLLIKDKQPTLNRNLQSYNLQLF